MMVLDFFQSYDIFVHCPNHGWEKARYSLSGTTLTCNGSLGTGKEYRCKLCPKVCISDNGISMHFHRVHQTTKEKEGQP